MNKKLMFFLPSLLTLFVITAAVALTPIGNTWTSPALTVNTIKGLEVTSTWNTPAVIDALAYYQFTVTVTNLDNIQSYGFGTAHLLVSVTPANDSLGTLTFSDGWHAYGLSLNTTNDLLIGPMAPHGTWTFNFTFTPKAANITTSTDFHFSFQPVMP